MVEPKYQIKWTSQYKKDIKLAKKRHYKNLSFRSQTLFLSMKNTTTTSLRETGKITVNVT